MIAYSPSMAHALGISDEDARSPTFAAYFSGDMSAVPGMESWATPYALSIMVRRRCDLDPDPSLKASGFQKISILMRKKLALST